MSEETVISSEVAKSDATIGQACPKIENVDKTFNKSEFINALKKDLVSTVKKVFINSLQKEVGFREVTVKEQKQLSRIMIDNENRKDIIYDAQCALINQVCLDSEFDIYTLTEFDKIKLMMAIYQTNMFKSEIKFKCKQCGTENQYKLNFANAIKRLDAFDITEKPFTFENDTWKFDFVVYYPSVRRVSDFYRSIVKKYAKQGGKDSETVSNMMNMDYINMFIKTIHMKNKETGSENDIYMPAFDPIEIDDIFSVFPQDVMYVDDGIINFISKNFIGKINDTFDKHKCGACGAIQEDTIDDDVESFF